MREWRTAGVAVSGFFATITIERWNIYMACITGTGSAIYVLWKIFKDIIRPWLVKKGLLNGN